MKYVCECDRCTGCKACMEKCPKNAITVHDDVKSVNAVIDLEKCINCGLCYNICPQNKPVEGHRPIEWYQGWAIQKEISEVSSSGGIASAISTSFLKGHGAVASCFFDSGKYRFMIAESTREILRFAGSHYVKSDMEGIYKQVELYLKSGRKLLFIGLPCQVAGLKKYVNSRFQDQLYTIDLICHGSPSPKILELYLAQNDVDISKVSNISFRQKTKFGILVDGRYVDVPGACDAYTLGFLNCLFYTKNCYQCQYAKLERISDITLGDSWGTELPKERLNKGLSLVLCQNQKGKELLTMRDIRLENVNLEKAIAANHQLSEPSCLPSQWKDFFDAMERKIPINVIVRKCYPKQYWKQRIKSALYSLLPK